MKSRLSISLPIVTVKLYLSNDEIKTSFCLKDGTYKVSSKSNIKSESNFENHLEGGWIGDNANQCTI